MAGPGVLVFPLGAHYAVLSTVSPKVLVPQIRARTAVVSGAARSRMSRRWIDYVNVSAASHAVLLGTFAAVAVGLGRRIYGVSVLGHRARTRALR